jgi:prepilin-type N-terminal cleavage/methylation domain-containing protein
MRFNAAKKRLKGFSLFELLTVVAIIGILASISVSTLSNLNGAYSFAANRRNAQEIVSEYVKAHTVGLDFTKASVAETVTAVVTGGYVSSGDFQGQFFGLPGLTQSDALKAQDFLKFSAEGLLTMKLYSE